LARAAGRSTGFTDVTKEAGIDFLYNFGDYTYENILESSGSGVTIMDYNGDIYPDLYMMNGTWLYFASERQAIEEENIFRRQQAEMQGQSPTQRFRKSGVPISEVTSAADNRQSFMRP